MIRTIVGIALFVFLFAQLHWTELHRPARVIYNAPCIDDSQSKDNLCIADGATLEANLLTHDYTMTLASGRSATLPAETVQSWVTAGDAQNFTWRTWVIAMLCFGALFTGLVPWPKRRAARQSAI